MFKIIRAKPRNKLHLFWLVLFFCFFLNSTILLVSAVAGMPKNVQNYPPTGSININNGVPYTNSTKVILSLSAQGYQNIAITQMRFSNNQHTWSVPQAYKTTKSWILTPANGVKIVYVKYKDARGVWSLSISSSIILDSIVPRGYIRINNGSKYTNSTTVTLNLFAKDSRSGVSQMQFSSDRIIWSSPEVYVTTKTWILPADNGRKTIYVRFSDNAGNWSRIYSDSIILDTNPPIAPTINPVITPIAIDSQVITGTKSIDTVNMVVTCATGTVGVITYPTDSSWSCPLTKLSEGSNIIIVKAFDKAGNQSVSTQTTIILGGNPPTGTIKINNGNQYTNTVLVTLTLTSANAVWMQFSNDKMTWSELEACAASKAWTLASGDGNKTVFIKFGDTAGNWSPIYSASIILDTTAPKLSIISPQDNEVIRP